MKTFQISLLAIVFILGCLTQSVFSQEECLTGNCNAPLSGPVQKVATAPVRATAKVIQSQPVRRVVAFRPFRRVFGLRCQ